MNHKVAGGGMRWRAWPQTLTVGVALLTAACGGAAAASSAPASSTSAKATASPSSSGQATAGESAYVQCMRTHGEPNFGPPSGPYVAGSQPDPNSATFQKAREACISLATGNGHVSSGDSSGGQP
jgi:hypothetical protein